MHTENKNDDQDQINTALAANIQTAVALWEAKDWATYKTTRDVLLDLIRSGRSNEVGIEQMQFIYFVNTHLLHRFGMGMTANQRIFLAPQPSHHPGRDQGWQVATEGRFWSEKL